MEEVGMIQKIWTMAPEIIATITSIITIASVIIAGTRTPNPDSVLGKIYRYLNGRLLILVELNKQGRNNSMWKTPSVKEVAVGLEINCYACAEI